MNVSENSESGTIVDLPALVATDNVSITAISFLSSADVDYFSYIGQSCKFLFGTTVLTYTAFDSSLNSASFVLTVVMQDYESPYFYTSSLNKVSTCPSNIVINNTFETASAEVKWNPVIGYDYVDKTDSKIRTGWL